MNWLLILVVLFIAGHMIWGYSKGFLCVAYTMVQWLLVMIFVTWATPYTTDFFWEHTEIPAKIEESCIEKLHDISLNNEAAENAGFNEKEIINEALGMQLPEILLDKVADTQEITEQMLEQSGIYEMLAHNLADLAVKGIAFLLVMLSAVILVKIIAAVLDIISKIPVLSDVNKVFGVLAGFIKGLMFTWLALAFLSFVAATPFGSRMVSYVYETPVLIWLYENNLVLTILLLFL